MPDGDNDLDTLPSLQPHPSEPRSAQQFRRTSLLPATTYVPQSSSSTSPQQSQSRPAVTAAEHRPNIIDPELSPDPREFYRQDTFSPFDDAQNSPSVGSRLPSQVDHRMISVASTSHGSARSTTQSDLYRKTSSPSPRHHQWQTVAGEESSRDSGENASRAPTVVSTGARIRQSSLKNLVDRFNKTVDEIPPVPGRTTSRTPSRAASPSATSIGDYPHQDSSTSRSFHRRRVEERLETTQSPPSLPTETVEQTSGLGRRPLFGELLTLNTAVDRAGYGIPSHARRRGSDSSVPSPNPFFIERRADLGPVVSPSSPTAWYLGYTPSLEAVNTGSHARGRAHRRSRSDTSWGISGIAKPAVASSLSTHMAVASPRNPASAISPDGSHSKSRIPLASRRMSHASDSGNSTSPSRSDSAAGLYNNAPLGQIPLAPKGSSRLPKPLAKSAAITSPEKMPRAPSAVTSPTRRDVVRGHGGAGNPSDKASLKVYVSAPPPKRSPPLRSSRPRQPVSTASTSASRGKVVDRVSHFQSPDGDTRNSRSRTRGLPELGNVDFAARRQKIQQAFNKSVQESVKKEEAAAERRRLARHQKDEEVRSQLIRQGELRKMGSTESPSTPDDPLPPGEGHTSDGLGTEPSEADTPVVAKLNPSGTPSLTIDTTTPVGEHEVPSVRDQSGSGLVDSPTLGVPDKASAGFNYTQSDRQVSDPISAVTADTIDTDTTHFDPEPQADLDQHDPTSSHRNILSRIMQLRESSSSSECDEDPYENDEKESIRIMLEPSRPTFYFDSADSGDSNGNDEETNEASDVTNEQKMDRWSMASWSSSLREQHLAPESQPDQNDESLQSVDESVNDHPSPADLAQHLSYHQHPGRDFLHEKPAMDSTLHKRQRSHPDTLMRQGGWDSKRVTQLYLEELTRGRFKPSLDRPWELVQREEEADVPSQEDSLTDEPVVIPRIKDLSSRDHVAHRASLNLRDDWESASPSIADWMQVAASDVPPPPPPKASEDTESVPRQTALGPTSQPPEPTTTDPDALWDGLGLAIHVQSPIEPAEKVLTPPIPDHSPPPVPTAPAFSPPVPQTVSPSIYASHPPSSIFPSAPFVSTEDHLAGRHSEDSYLTQAGFTPSPRTVASSATSHHQVAVPRPSADTQVSSPTPEQRRLRKRRHVIKELVDTEYTFGRDMKVVEDIYKGTSSSCLDISVDDVRTLFGNSDQVVQFSMTFQDALKHAARSVYVMPKSQRWSSKRGTRSGQDSWPTDSQSPTEHTDFSSFGQDRQTFVGKVFMENMAPMEKVYADYLKNHDAANKTLQTLQQNPKVAIWLKECRDWADDLTTAWDLDSLLVKPVQRILKYPLLLTELLDSTSPEHPDHAALTAALEGVTNISVRINELKKRADLVGQVVSSRKRKESDVRTGLSKAFGRRTEKLRQQVGLSEMFEDREYDALSQRFNDSFFQLQVVMRDVEMYTREIQSGMDRFNGIVLAIEGCIDVAQSNYPELESKWHRLRMYVREIMNIALPEHITSVRKGAIDPMITLLKLYEGPQKVMQKRNKRLIDYARYKAIKDRGDRADKKTTEQGEQFSVLNEALKDELPRLFGLTASLMEVCLEKFVDIQKAWFQMLQQKLSPILDHYPGGVGNIISDWSGDFSFAEAQILSLGLCNGALLSEAVNMVNFTTPPTDPGASSPRRPSTITSSSARTLPGTVESSPKVSYDLGNSGSIVQFPGLDGLAQQHSNGSQAYLAGAARRRTSSTMSAATGTGVIPDSNGHAVHAKSNSSARPSTGSARSAEPFPSLPRLSLDMPFMQEPLLHGTDQYEPTTGEMTASPGGRYSGFFSSAMPMSDSPHQDSSIPTGPLNDPKVLFLAASLYEFNIDRARREAGYSYLTYVAGEIFDVIAEKGELWLARNQDDPTRQIGWIWTQHFAKLSPT